MKTMKCKSCGAKLKVEKGQEYVTCEYCGTEFKLDEDVKSNANFNMDEAKKKLDSMNDIMGKSTKVTGIVMIAFMIPFIIIFAIVFSISTKHIKGTVKNTESQIDTLQIKSTGDIENKMDVYKFNLPFTMAAGTQYGSSVGRTLDDVISNNKEYPEKQITVIYNEINTQDERAIIDIKHSLEDFSKYEVIINKDKDEFVCEVIIEDIKE